MTISEILRRETPSFSFEFFPPKSEAEEETLWTNIRRLSLHNPHFITVTWGAGGGTRRKTLDITAAIMRDLKTDTMSHLTCVGASRGDLTEILEEIALRGLENVLALRGDPPKGDATFRPHPDGFSHAHQLVSFIKSRWNFCVGVAGYPEGHPETPDKQADLYHLKQKVDAGAEFVTTQLFFDNSHYFEFVDRARSIGIDVPILPGIMPVTNVKQIKRFTTLCGAQIPTSLEHKLEDLQSDGQGVVDYGIEYATRQCEELLKGGAPGVHFYTLNRSRSTFEILKNLRGGSKASS